MLRTGSTVSAGGVKAFQGVQGDSPVLCKNPRTAEQKALPGIHPMFGEVTT